MSGESFVDGFEFTFQSITFLIRKLSDEGRGWLGRGVGGGDHVKCDLWD